MREIALLTFHLIYIYLDTSRMYPCQPVIFLRVRIRTHIISSPDCTHCLSQPSYTCSCIRLDEEGFIQGRKARVHAPPLGALVWSILIHFQHQDADHDRIINRSWSVSGIIHTLLDVAVFWKVHIQPDVSYELTDGEIICMYKVVNKIKSIRCYM